MFHFEDAQFKEDKEGDWADYVKTYGGELFFSSIKQPEHDLKGSDNLIKKGYKVENLIEFPGH